MTALAIKHREAAPQPSRPRGQPGRVFASQSLSPATIFARPPDSGQYAEGAMGNAKLKVVVNCAIFSALKGRAEDRGARRKIVARELGVSDGTVKKLRANVQGVSFETIQAICQRDPTIRALVIQSLGGDVVGFDPGAVNQILRGSNGR